MSWSESQPGEKRIKWDEEVIMEHNKERGTRQKIDEPPTPYAYIDEDGHEISRPAEDLSNNWEAVNAKLHYESEKQKSEEADKQKRIEIGEPEPENNPNNEKMSFAQKRASHYNEFFVLKSLKNQRDEDEDDEN